MPNGTPFCTLFRDAFDVCTLMTTCSPNQTIAAGTTWKFTSTEVGDGTDFQSISRSAAIKTDGTLWLWGGYNSSGKIGDGTVINRSSPVQTIAGGTTWALVSSGGYTSGEQHSVGIKSDGTLWTWGRNYNGTLGTNSNGYTGWRSSPVQTVAGGTTWKQASTNYGTVGAIKTDGTLWMWGSNGYGVLGTNSTIRRSSPVQTIAGNTNWKQVSVGQCFGVAAIKTDGTLWTWGHFGGVADGVTVNRSSPVQTIAGGTNWKQVSSNGRGVSGAVKTDGTLWVWGCNFMGQLGDGGKYVSWVSSPVQTIAGGNNWKQVSAFGSRGFGAVKTDGTLWTWGYNCLTGCESFKGILGDGTLSGRSSPVQTIAGGNNWAHVCMGTSAIAAKTDGTLWTWGPNIDGALASGFALCSNIQNVLDLGTAFIEKDYLIDVYPNLIPQQKSSSLWMWGTNVFGQFGDNNTLPKSSPVQTVAGGTNWRCVGGQANHTVGVKTDGTLWAWGENSQGTLGDNTLLSRSSPVQTIAGGTNWLKVTASSVATIAIKCDGTLWTWGNNCLGVLGNCTTVNRSSPGQTIAGGSDWKEASAGTAVSAAIKNNGTLWVWGSNTRGLLGINSSASFGASSPVQTIAAGTNWKQVSAGPGCHVAAIKTDGTLWGWGYNFNGQLGNGVAQFFGCCAHSSPIQTIAGGTNWKQVSAGKDFSSAIKTDGTLWGWGSGLGLGANSLTSQCSPVQTTVGGNNWKQVGAGWYTNSAIKTDGTLWVWGSGQCGGLGTNSCNNQSVPVQTITGGTNWKLTVGGIFRTSAIKEEGDW